MSKGNLLPCAYSTAKQQYARKQNKGEAEATVETDLKRLFTRHCLPQDPTKFGRACGSSNISIGTKIDKYIKM